MRVALPLLFLVLLTFTPSLYAQSKIEHIVVLMLENRAFDHMLGYLHLINPNIDGVSGNETCPYDPTDLSKGFVTISNNAGYITPADPDHSVPSTRDQVFGYQKEVDPAPMNGFVYNYFIEGPDPSAKGADIMKAFAPKTVPVISSLALEYTIFDKWHSSVPGPTQPNRMFFHSATSYGATQNVVDSLALGYPQKTLYDNLYESGYSWRDYWVDFPSILFLRNLRDPVYAFNYYEMFEFEEDALSGDLPTFTFLEPRWFDFLDWYASDEHPPHDVQLGESLIAYIYNSLRQGPKWNQTLFIITYDEHGGFYDHVSPPMKNVPNPDGRYPPPNDDPFNFTRLGVRVPTVMISPWLNKGSVVHEPPTSHFEHSSMSATLVKWFNLTGGFLTKRDAWAAPFDFILDQRTEPRTDCPEQILPPAGLSYYEAFKKKLKTKISEESVKDALKTGQFGQSVPITGLQKDILAMAYGLDPNFDISKTYDNSWLDAIGVHSEYDGALYVERQTRQFLEQSKKSLKDL